MRLIESAIEELRTAAESAVAAFRTPATGTSGARWRVPALRDAALLSLLVVPFLFFGWERCGVAGCPPVDRLAAYQPDGAPVVLDRDGEVIATLAPVRRDIVAFDSLPEHVGAAFVAVEDQRFYRHSGIDLRRVAGAALADLRAGGFVQGSSTVTMQLARNVFPDRLPAEKSLRRKLLEVRVARGIERRFSKEEILELYLNHIYFGNGVYGIEAASRHYFGRPASQLTLGQAAALAGIPRAPSFYDPRRNPDAVRSRRDLVLSMMVEQALVDADDAEAAAASPLAVTASPPRRSDDPAIAPYFVEAVRRAAEDELGDALYSAAFRIHTTLDRRAQSVAEEELARQLGAIEAGRYGRYSGSRYRSTLNGEAPAYLQGAVVILDAVDGDVLALVGGRDASHSAFDRATRAYRQVGSAFKPFVFAAALADGYAPSQHVADSPLRLELEGGEVWEPRNFTGGFEGEVTLRDALVRSKNVPAVRLAGSVGFGDVSRVARRAGVRSSIPQLPSMALGTAALTPLEITAAYTVFANGGRAVAPRFITHIEEPGGETVREFRSRSRKVLDPAVAFLVTDMLAEAVDKGTANAVRQVGFRGSAAGKTGTTDNGADAWFVGYTPEFVTGTWIGFDRPAAIVEDASGGRLAAPLWSRTMQRLYRGRDGPGDWVEPDNIVRHAVDPATGLLLADGCTTADGRDGVDEIFMKGSVPARACPAGEARTGRGLLARAFAFTRNTLYRAGAWTVARIRGGDDEPQRAERERMLGAPRLPRAAEVRAPALDSTEYPRLLGVPWVPDTALPAVDTLGIDTLGLDTLRLDTLRLDPLRPDTLRRDTLRPDTLRPDTMRRDTLPPDTLARATLPRDTTGTGILRRDTLRDTVRADTVGTDAPGSGTTRVRTAA